LWDTHRDEIEGGQWFHGKLSADRCDLSPDGKLLLYFGGKFRARDLESGYGLTYTAIRRPPYFTALACSAPRSLASGPVVCYEIASLAAERFESVIAPEWALQW